MKKRYQFIDSIFVKYKLFVFKNQKLYLNDFKNLWLKFVIPVSIKLQYKFFNFFDLYSRQSVLEPP